MKKALILTLACLVVFGYFFTTFTLYSQQQTPAETWAAAEIALGKAMTRMETLNGDLKKHQKEFSELSRNALISLVVAFTPVDALKTLFTGTGTPERAFELKSLMISIFVQQEALNGDLANLDTARDTAYNAYVLSVSQPLDKGPEPVYADIPTVYLPCMGGCGYTYSSASTGMGNLANASLQGHAVYCSHEPHKRNQNWYWGCQYTSCPVSEDHEYTACVGGCGNLGPERWAVPNTYGNISYGTILKKQPRTGNGWELATIVAHKTRCGERLRGSDWTCGYHYYKCNTSNTCPNVENHISGGGTPPSGQNPPSPTPSLHPCNVHNTTATGDHSLQASCSSTDGNGNSCTVTGFYACQSHTHSYPSPPTPTVRCGNRWSGRGACTYGRVVSGSDAYEHQATCSTHGTYWSCNPTAYARHGESLTCRRSGCGSSYTRCTKGDGSCTGGQYTWHY